MRTVKRLLAALLFTAFATSASAEKLRNHFDFDAPLREPAFFDFVVLGAPGEADWKVVADPDPPSPPNQLTQTFDNRPGDSVAAALRRNAVFRDGTWSVALKKGLGRGGIVFRLADDKNFLFLWVNTTTGEARMFSYRDGKPRELARGRTEWSARWGVLTITGKEAAISAQWDGKPLLEATDPRPVAGRAGVATCGAGLTSFDEFVLGPAETRKP